MEIISRYHCAMSALDESESISVIDGPVKSKAAVHRDGDWHVAAHVWIITPGGRVLLQRRSMEKENWPGYWDVSAAGHVSAGETPAEAAVRETFEELGVRIEPPELEWIGELREEFVLRGGAYIDREVHEIYVVRREPETLTLQASEVEAVMYVPLDELTAVTPLVPHEAEYQLLRDFMAARNR
jgi:isopentenyldiphosphate isomerase